MNINTIRNLIPGMTLMKEGVIFQLLPAGDEFRYEVNISYGLNEQNGVLSIQAWSKLKVSADSVVDALLFCNKFSQENMFAQVFFDTDDMDFNARWAVDTENLTEAEVEQQIKLVIPAIWHFFVEVGKEF